MYRSLDTSALGITGSQSEIIELALTYGFRGMDLDVVEFANLAGTRGMAHARRLIDSAKLRVSSFNLPLDLEASDEAFGQGLSRLEAWADTAEQLGCQRCLATLQPAGDQLPYHENFERYRRRFAEIAKVLRPHGIRLGVGFRAAASLRREKTFQFIHDPDAAGLLLNMVGAENIGPVLDVWDLCVAGGSIDAIRTMKPEDIVLVRLADAPPDKPLAELDEEDRLPPGQTGRLDLPAVLKSLAEMGYRGPVVPAPHRAALGSSRREAIVKALGESMDRLWRDAGLGPRSRPATSVDG